MRFLVKAHVIYKEYFEADNLQDALDIADASDFALWEDEGEIVEYVAEATKDQPVKANVAKIVRLVKNDAD